MHPDSKDYCFNKGKCIILNHVNFDVKDEDLPQRLGSDADAQTLKTSFEQLNFEVDLKKDLTYSGILKFISEGNKHLFITK